MAKLNENFKLWNPKPEPPMSNRDTLNYLIKYYNLKRLRDWKKERWENSEKNNTIIENLQSIRRKLEAFDLLADALKDEIEMYEVSPGQTRLEINSLGYDMTNEEAKILMEVIKND